MLMSVWIPHPIVLGLLTEELDAFVYFNVLLATNVRGLEFVIRHLIEFVVDKGKSFIAQDATGCRLFCICPDDR